MSKPKKTDGKEERQWRRQGRRRRRHNDEDDGKADDNDNDDVDLDLFVLSTNAYLTKRVGVLVGFGRDSDKETRGSFFLISDVD